MPGKKRKPLPDNWQYVDKPPADIKQLNPGTKSFLWSSLRKWYEERIAEQTWNGVFYKSKLEYNDVRCRETKRGIYREDKPFNMELYNEILKRVGESYASRPNSIGMEQSAILYHNEYGIFEGTPSELVKEFPYVKDEKAQVKSMINNNTNVSVRGWKLKHYVDQNDIVDFGL